ncbi:hypothetical protein M427DRAFT_53357 [Gonapodya prolifera JEL478]|uniref:GATA-domain-containing protein n=1 Tax=Gonapodya prolifera (strain JEL478) TaxID=1344416 RepID=A0A139AQ65_GONPJ|nr:hypothetical protein M427DRAFT_53357 [Gonapodya prolifera JEL478]|eukprot:KXS18876.1 hypothetical protein M427DRAFT_53357 [Gonapodya prolifera JEL478]
MQSSPAPPGLDQFLYSAFVDTNEGETPPPSGGLLGDQGIGSFSSGSSQSGLGSLHGDVSDSRLGSWNKSTGGFGGQYDSGAATSSSGELERNGSFSDVILGNSGLASMNSGHNFMDPSEMFSSGRSNQQFSLNDPPVTTYSSLGGLPFVNSQTQQSQHTRQPTNPHALGNIPLRGLQTNPQMQQGRTQHDNFGQPHLGSSSDARRATQNSGLTAGVVGQSPTPGAPTSNMFGMGPVRSTFQLPAGFPQTSALSGLNSGVNANMSGPFVAPGAISSLPQNLDETVRSYQPFSVPPQQFNVSQPQATASSSAATQASTLQTPGTTSSEKERVPISRHINSVINHFTSSKEGYRRLLQELDDWLFVISPQGQFLYASPSTKKHVGYSPEELVGKALRNILHVEDADFVFAALDSAVSEKKDYSLYCRFLRKSGEPILLEVKGKPYDSTYTQIAAGSSSTDASSDTKFVINTCREYRSKASLSVDSILDLSIENIKLRRQLEQTLIARGQDPSTHLLLKELESEAPQNLHPTDLFDAQEAKERGLNGMGNLAALGAFGDDDEDDEPKPPSMGNAANAAKRKAKPGGGEEIFCHQCGTTSSPEWRRGPDGPKTLCNACGLAFAKKQKKSQGIE